MRKRTFLLLSILIFSCIGTFMTYAASKSKVGKIYLMIDSNAGIEDDGDYVSVTAYGNNTDRFFVDNAEIINDDGGVWTNSYTPEIEITIFVQDEELYYFSGNSRSDFKLELSSSVKDRYDKVEFVKAQRKDNNSTLILTVRLLFDKDADISRAIEPTEVKWDTSQNGCGVWNASKSAKYYQIQLIKDGEEKGEIISIYNTKYDFEKCLIDAGSYQFKIRSVKASNNSKSRWVVSDTLNVNDVENSGQWLLENGIGWRWQKSDGSYEMNQWKKISEKWYYFDSEGYMATGWIKVDEVYYFLDLQTGELYVNRRTPDNYWVNEKGEYIPGI